MAIIGFAAGVWLLQLQAALPANHALAALLSPLTVALLPAFHRRMAAAPVVRRLVLLALGLSVGFGWAGVRAQLRLADALPGQWEGRDIAVVGVIAGLPELSGEGVRFEFAVESAAAPLPQRLQLSWYRPHGEAGPPPRVQAGERWEFTLRLRRPHGLANPHGFDYEAWLLERGVRATGHVRGAGRRLDDDAGGVMAAVHRRRDAIRTRFLDTLGDAPYAGMLVALAVGDQDAIPQAQWELFRRTGIAHLVSISGMHVSLVALLAGGACAFAWRRVPVLALRLAARRAGALAALAAALAYALLAGMGIPVMRAVIMLAIGAVALLLGRDTAPGRVLALALLAVLVVDPWAVSAAGFWLSFGAVGAIVFLLGGRIGGRSGWRAAARLQLGITLATVPALLALFQSFSVVSPLANALAIPVVNLLVTPLVLLAAALPWPPLLELAHLFTAWTMVAVEWLGSWPAALWQQAAIPGWLVAAACAAVLVLLAPRATPARPAAAMVLAGALVWQPARPAPGGFRAVVLDVGNGLAVHVQTAGGDLLYDAGPPYGEFSDAGQRVVLPYLAARGVRRLDRLVLSHDDADHVGGAASVLDAMRVEAVLGGAADVAGVPRQACVAGLQWVWDAVRFSVLNPSDEGGGRRDNDDSCVIRVEADGGSLLLTGDIGRAAEAGLLARTPAAVASSVVVAAHHGSRSSSSPAFVDAALPEAVVFSVGHLSRFGHPHPEVWARWSAAGARNWRTDSQGAVEIEVDGSGVTVTAQRERAARYWHGR